MDFVVDGRNSVAYLLPKKSAPPTYTHNRLGAAFVPTETYTNRAVAWVITGGPAYEAGVRDGDVLLQVDEVACTSWNEGWLSRFRRPAGTKLKLTLERDGKPFKTTATLRDILRPKVDRQR
jgi:C-terminal processing protease CtpA/Prc